MLKIIIFILICVALEKWLEVVKVNQVFVNVSNGKIKGSTMKSRNGRHFFSFRGIPYAKPPIGDLRFKSPEEASNWEGIYDATKDASACLQLNHMFFRNPQIEGSEDCLYLNVYTPNIEVMKKLPVIVQIHYGGFAAGNSKSTFIGPQYLLDKDVVYVSFNYRLGIFGFYSTLDDASPGNYGLKDQLLALRWVKKNIAQFGGDPNLVTIIGMSAGAISVHHHLLNPGSQGLFHRVIASSGTVLNFWGQPLNFIQKDFFKPAAQVVGCNGTTTETIQCMRKVCAEDVLLLQDNFKFFDNEPIVMFNIVKEKKSELNPEPFLEEDPIELIKKGKFTKVPLIMGITQDEGLVRSGTKLLHKDLFEQLVNEFDNIVPKLVLPPLLPSKNKEAMLWTKIKEFYFKNEIISLKKPETLQGFTDFYGDAMFIYGTYQSVMYHAYKGYPNLWMYKFEYKGEQSFLPLFANTNRTIDFEFGVSHGDDYIYLFPAPDILPDLPKSDLKMSEIMVEIWTHFAVHGEPPKLNDGSCTLDWKRMPSIKGKNPIKNEYLTFLNITKSSDVGGCSVLMKMQNGMLEERMSFWEHLDVNFQIKDLNWD